MNLTFFIGAVVIILTNIGGMSFYTFGTQFFISMVDTTVVVMTMLVLQIIDFKHTKEAIEKDRLVKLGHTVEEESSEEVVIPTSRDSRSSKKKEKKSSKKRTPLGTKESLNNSQKILLRHQDSNRSYESAGADLQATLRQES